VLRSPRHMVFPVARTGAHGAGRRADFLRRSAARWVGALAFTILVPAVVGCSGNLDQGQTTDDGRVHLTVERPLMGTLFRIDVIVPDEAMGRQAIDAAFAEIERAEEILSNWSETSQISELNRAAGVQPVVVSDELLAVLARALDISRLTEGAFDITFASCGGLWSIRERRIPTDGEIAACLEHVDYRRVALDLQQSAVFVSDPETRVGIAGLAKGYRVDRAARVLDARGIVDYVVDGGGDMRVSSVGETGSWEIKVAHPRRPGEPLGTVDLASGAIATSGDYEWFFEADGVRYHHILDPATGRPARRCVSATVIAETAMDADAMATGLFVMGPVGGIALAERLPGVEAMVIAPDLSVHTTSGFPEVVVLGASIS
jgi:thiamine biosynthesis lipoprotein